MRSARAFAGDFTALFPFSTISLVTAANATVWDYAPDFSRDQFPPYPPLTSSNGTNITVQSLIGTRLFGWQGCGKDERKMIAEAFDDFHTLVSLPEVYVNIDWRDRAATDFFGASVGQNPIPTKRRAQIQQIFTAAQQIHSRAWWDLPPPWVRWIQVRCSEGDGSGDPGNFCGDRQPNNGQCQLPRNTAPAGGNNRLEAYSNPSAKYSEITFCDGFFRLNSLSDAINNGKRRAKEEQNNLETWNSRARCFLHEVTHLDCFMNTPSKGPVIEDLQFTYKNGTQQQDEEAYGPYNAKIVRNYVKTGKAGFYTQRNADTYAYFATAKYVQRQINSYPTLPNARSMKPVSPPRNSLGEPLTSDTDTDTDISEPAEDSLDTDEMDPAPPNIQSFSIPGCPDRFDLSLFSPALNSSSTSSALPSSTQPVPDQPTGPPPTVNTCTTAQQCPACPAGQCADCSATWAVSVENPAYGHNAVPRSILSDNRRDVTNPIFSLFIYHNRPSPYYDLQ